MGKTNYRIITTHKMANSTYDYKGTPHHKLPALLQSRHIATMQKKQTAFRIKVKQNTATGLYRQPHEGHQTKWSERRIKWYTCIHWRCVTFYVFCLFVCSPPTHPPIFFLSFLSPPPPPFLFLSLLLPLLKEGEASLWDLQSGSDLEL